MIAIAFPNYYLKRLGHSISTILLHFIKFQKQPSKGVLRKSCSESIQQIYRRIPMRKCEQKRYLNNVTKQFSKQLFCKRRREFFFCNPVKQYTWAERDRFWWLFCLWRSFYHSSPMSDTAHKPATLELDWNGLK